MRTSATLAGALLALTLWTPRSMLAQSGYELFQQALLQERASGSLQEAIQLYQRIVEDHAADRELAARALVQLGQAYEKLGSPQARLVYQRVLGEYGEQREQVARARSRLRELAAASAGEMSLRRIAAGPEVEGVFNALSPDGRRLTFVDWETGDLAVLDLESGERRRLTNVGYPELAYYSVFSPDGRHVAYTWLVGDTAVELRSLALAGGEPTVLHRASGTGLVQPTDWSPDGRWVVAVVEREAVGNQIVLIPAAGGPARVLKSLEWRYPGKVAFRPGGKVLAYDVQVDQDFPQRDVYLLATDGSQETALVSHPADDIVLGWTPDGGELLVSSDRTGAPGAWLFPVDERGGAGTPRLARAELGAVTPLTLSPSGAFYYVSSTYMWEVHTAPFDLARGEVTEEPTLLSRRFAGRSSGPAFSPDGRWLAYRRGRDDGDATLVLRSTEDGEEREVAMEMKSFHVRGVRWSPDGKQVVAFGRDARGRWGLYTVTLETGEATLRSVPGESYIGQPRWAPDGSGIYYLQDGGLQLLDPASGRERTLARVTQPIGGSSFDVSPDGRWLAYTTLPDTVQEWTSGDVSLRVMPATGGPPRELLSSSPPEEISLAWTPAGAHLLFTKTRSRFVDGGRRSSRELWRVDVSNGEAMSLGLALPGLQHLTIRPDGQEIAFTTASGESEIWVMENFLPTTDRR